MARLAAVGALPSAGSAPRGKAAPGRSLLLPRPSTPQSRRAASPRAPANARLDGKSRRSASETARGARARRPAAAAARPVGTTRAPGSGRLPPEGRALKEIRGRPGLHQRMEEAEGACALTGLSTSDTHDRLENSPYAEFSRDGMRDVRRVGGPTGSVPTGAVGGCREPGDRLGRCARTSGGARRGGAFPRDRGCEPARLQGRPRHRATARARSTPCESTEHRSGPRTANRGWLDRVDVPQRPQSVREALRALDTVADRLLTEGDARAAFPDIYGIITRRVAESVESSPSGSASSARAPSSGSRGGSPAWPAASASATWRPCAGR